MSKKKIIIGITGILASGKSTVSDEFASLGAFKIDADGIAHDLLSGSGAVAEDIKSAFGAAILTQGAIDRKKLGELVFFDTEKLKLFSRIIHPVIIERIRMEIKASTADVVVVDAPLLFEVGLEKEMDMVVVVTASEKNCLKRAVLRGIPEEKARRIMASQMSQEEKSKRADHIIVNDDNIEKIKEGVKRVWQKK